MGKKRETYTKDELIWINDMEQANYYMMKGISSKGVSIHENGKISIAFLKEDTKYIYFKWLEKIGKLKNKEELKQR